MDKAINHTTRFFPYRTFRRFILLLAALVLCFFQSIAQGALSSPMEQVFAEAREQWITGQKDPSVEAAVLYSEMSLGVLSDGSSFYPLPETFYLNQRIATVGSVDSLTNIKLIRATDAIWYEFGEIYTAGNLTYQYLFVWRFLDNSCKLELEFLAPTAASKVEMNGIQEARENWIRLCNRHNAAALVETMYLPNAIYFSHRPPVIGTAAISVEYSYMNRASYQLQLQPLEVRAVSDQLVMEIGQCSGSYNGKYVIIWKRTSNGRWQILLDTNV